MSSVNEKIITKKARQLYGSQGEFCRKHGYSELNFSSFKKRILDKVDKVLNPLGLELSIKEKEKSNETSV